MSNQDPSAIWSNRWQLRFRCSQSDEIHAGLPEVSFDAPDACAALEEDERRGRVLLEGDFCILDGRRHFIRATLSVPVTGYPDPFRWAAWVEVPWTPFKLYWEDFVSSDNSHIPPFTGRLANAISGYRRTLGLSVLLHPQSNGERPSVRLRSRTHPLAVDQRLGITPQHALRQAQCIGVLLMVA